MTLAVFLDFYNTLARFEPSREERQVQICREFGLQPSVDAIRKAYPAADDYFYKEAVRSPVEKRPEAEKLDIFAEYERHILAGAGLEVDHPAALRIWQRLRQLPTKFVLYDDALPSIRSLRQTGVALGIISNISRDWTRLFKELGLESELDFIVTSVDVPPGKPAPSIFLKALEHAGAPAEQAIHVGDQYHIDVVGARNVGIRPILLDRDNFYPEITDCLRIRGLDEVQQHL
ncbi:MAG: HAD-IA family hydrolase [Chloroflexi bacterium]|nr:HAD-IA family hydrolase [Chloroflexota bacterium]